MKPVTRNGLIAAGVGGLGQVAALVWTGWAVIPAVIGLVGLGYFGDQWRIQRQAEGEGKG